MSEASGAVNAVEAARARGWRKVYFNLATIPYWGMHVFAIVGLAIVGWSWTGALLCLALYIPRMFFVTGGYHRYFSHRSYKTSRWFQFVLALGAETTAQKGILWWAAHHRTHHRYSDERGDLHSAKRDGFWWSHMGWIVADGFEGTDLSKIRDFAKYPELRWLNRWWMLVVIATGVATYLLGGFFALVWGFAVCQVLIWHGTFTINSLSHLWGSRRYKDTGDDSRNNPVLAAITLGEGWHNNHHYYQSSARQGFFWWEFDVTYYILRTLAAVGLVWDVRGVPDHVRDRMQGPADDAANEVLPRTDTEAVAEVA
jgi:stearoyl-CoA desaturase (delta-9 desaturase)